MTLGTKLQKVHLKVNKKLGFQDASITFRKSTKVAPDRFGQSYQSVSNSDITITGGVKIYPMTARDLDAAGVFKINDLVLIVPGSILTESQIDGSTVIYKSKDYSIINASPVDIVSGVAVNWKIVLRQKDR